MQVQVNQEFKIPRDLRFAGRIAMVRNVGISHVDLQLRSGKTVSFCLASLEARGIKVVGRPA